MKGHKIAFNGFQKIEHKFSKAKSRILNSMLFIMFLFQNFSHEELFSNKQLNIVKSYICLFPLFVLAERVCERDEIETSFSNSKDIFIVSKSKE